jgi:hypothetical protein
LSAAIIIVSWYAIDFIRYGDYDEKKRIAAIKGDTILLSVLQIEPDASYKQLEVKISDETQVIGIGIQSLFTIHYDDLKPGQKVRVWYNTNAENENIAEKVVVYNYF